MRMFRAAGICSLVQIEHFGEAIPLGGGRDTGYSDTPPSYNTLDEFVGELPELIEDFKVSHGYDFDICSLVFAALIDKQPISQGILRDFGFNEIGPLEYKKYKHKISYFTMPVPDFMDTLTQHQERIKKEKATAKKPTTRT